jgi:hypothetical protein
MLSCMRSIVRLVALYNNWGETERQKHPLIDKNMYKCTILL